jgi:hypothetical protein
VSITEYGYLFPEAVSVNASLPLTAIMHGRGRSTTEPSDAPYQSLPQVPTSLEEPTPFAVIQETAAVEEYEDGVRVEAPIVDPRIRWVHFILGNAVLLPWNGACTCRATLSSP